MIRAAGLTFIFTMSKSVHDLMISDNAIAQPFLFAVYCKVPTQSLVLMVCSTKICTSDLWEREWSEYVLDLGFASTLWVRLRGETD